MNPLPAEIRDFLLEHHVASIATAARGEPWAASCFYAFDAASVSLVILSSEETRHGAAMLAHEVVAGTIAGQTRAIHQIRGIQFVARARRLEGDADQAAYSLYCRRHPVAKLKKSTVWQLQLNEVKYTDNRNLFGMKTHWRRDGE